jgi:hypothetical protein
MNISNRWTTDERREVLLEITREMEKQGTSLWGSLYCFPNTKFSSYSIVKWAQDVRKLAKKDWTEKVKQDMIILAELIVRMGKSTEDSYKTGFPGLNMTSKELIEFGTHIKSLVEDDAEKLEKNREKILGEPST